MLTVSLAVALVMEEPEGPSDEPLQGTLLEVNGLLHPMHGMAVFLACIGYMVQDQDGRLP